MTCGVFCISMGSDSYIASSTNIMRAWQRIRLLLRRNQYPSSALQSAYNALPDASDITITVLEQCHPSLLSCRTAHWIEHMHPTLSPLSAGTSDYYNRASGHYRGLVLVSPTGEEYRDIVNLGAFCRAQGLTRQGYSSIYSMVRGVTSGWRGWSCYWESDR